jgi:hypothetical protein
VTLSGGRLACLLPKRIAGKLTPNGAGHARRTRVRKDPRPRAASAGSEANSGQPTNDPIGKRTAADLGAWLVFEDESGQGLRPPKGRTWSRRGRTPVVRVAAANGPRLSLAALVATKPGHRPRLIYRTHRGRRGARRKGFTETDYAALLDAAHQQLGGPIVLVWDNLNSHNKPTYFLNRPLTFRCRKPLLRAVELWHG